MAVPLQIFFFQQHDPDYRTRSRILRRRKSVDKAAGHALLLQEEANDAF